MNIQTAAEREEAFRRDFDELLEKHKAELEITDDRKPYGLHSGVAVVTIMSEYDDDGNQTAEYTEFKL